MMLRKLNSLPLRNIFVSVCAIFLAFPTASILLVAAGIDPLHAFLNMYNAAFGSAFAISITIGKTIPRLLPALGIALALRGGLWNIGAEGQIYIGALACAGVALYGPLFPFPLGIVLCFIAAAVAGAGWAAMAGALRSYRGINEVISSLMLVYVAIQFTNYMVEGPWLVENSTFPVTRMIPHPFRLPIVWPRTLLNAGVFVALVAAFTMGFIIARTKLGLWLRAIGGNERAAEVIGLPVKSLVVVAMAISGTFAGLAGAIEVLGTNGRLIEGFSPGYGFQAIAIALLGRLNPLGIIGASLVFGSLDAGSPGLQAASGSMSASIAPIIEGLAVVYLLAGLGLESILSRRRMARAALQKTKPAVGR
jgi:ABC-type uncharacterized transport system permease subunit